ncbi:MAG TPA: DUF6705 family protein [Mucilaginibacter sp.]|nr:DUF6705 family protein [Mucilaginibacter sp.]
MVSRALKYTLIKTLTITIILLFGCMTVKASPINKDTTYRQFPDLSKFNGTWQYVDSGITFKIVLKAEKIYYQEGEAYMDHVEGYHLYSRGNKVIQSSIGKKKTIILGNYFYDFVEKTEPKNAIQFVFTDLERETNLEGRTELLPGNKLRWTLKNNEGVRYIPKGQKAPDRNIHVPNHIILTKVE